MNPAEWLPVPESRMGIARSTEALALEHEIGPEFYERLMGFAPDGILVTDIDFNIILANRHLADIHGFENENVMLGQNMLNLLGEDHDESFMRRLANVCEQPILRDEREFVRADGSTFPGELNIASFMHKGEVVAFAAMIKDVTKEKEEHEKLRRSEEKHRRVFEQSPNAIIVADREGRIVEANKSAVRISGYPLGELIGKHALELILIGEDEPDFMLEELLEDGLLRVERSILTNEGEERIVEINSSTLSDGRLVANIQDITERRKLMELNNYKTYHDALTGLYNRLSFNEELEKLENGRQYPVSMVMIDLDELKAVNDAQGHHAGDQLIISAAEALKNTFQRTGDHISRLGGDEFSVLLPQVDERTVEELLERLRSKLREMNVSASVGFATAHDWRESLEQKRRIADQCMFMEKRAKKNPTA